MPEAGCLLHYNIKARGCPHSASIPLIPNFDETVVIPYHGYRDVRYRHAAGHPLTTPALNRQVGHLSQSQALHTIFQGHLHECLSQPLTSDQWRYAVPIFFYLHASALLSPAVRQ
ncbi:hypothetical protein ElyMa_000795300 [Elysia marginata]|uniref:Uncharacterized protein n=1 Tax=Elysia marginata TaxID=1093978 RepID=A0AAV4GX12_9GAST|nr:hypothetical protein ElyMa_000795300 [Elysia marginata]